MSAEKWFIQYRLLLLALVGAFAFHGVLLFAGTYRNTYDAYVHIFFADHYARSWWIPWDTRWYTGFTMVSYPPLTHQLTALLSKITSLPTGFIVVMLFSAVVTTLGVYRFSRLWVAHRPALYASLLTVFSSSIAETVHVFGQLPTMFVMGVMLNALPYVWAWIERGKLRDLLRGWGLLMIAAAGHHVTTLFGMVFFSGPILATLLLLKFRTPHPQEPPLDDAPLSLGMMWRAVKRRVRRVMPALIREGVFGVGLIIILVVTVLPYWLWSRSDPITQITIPHASRDNFLVNTAAGFMFFIVPWGVMLMVLPYAIYKGLGSRNWILALSLMGMAFVGTGGTTPIPAKLLGGAFYILTLDRFTFWATIIILPFAGQFVESLLHGRLGGWIIAHLGAWWRLMVAGALGFALITFALFTANLTQFRRFQPAPIEMTPIVEFLAKDNHDKWRYLTLGFGDQMAWLSAQTTALNVEGNYHSARRLPELTSTPIERLDGAKFTEIPGLGSLQQFLTNPHRYNLKYVFVNDDFYEPLLYFSGWHRLGQLENDVQVWERADVPPLPATIPTQIYPAWQRLMWGVLPVGSIFITLFLFTITQFINFNQLLSRIPLLGRVVRGRLVRFWLLDEDARAPLPASEDWQLWRRFIRRLPKISVTPLAKRAVYGAVLALMLMVVLGLGVFMLRKQADTPQSTLLAYYDALDFKRFTESYTYLETALTREEYLRWLSLRGGILASFAKLENLSFLQETTSNPNDAVVHVSAEWLTALGSYTVQDRYELVNSSSGWRIRLDVSPPPPPRETVISTTAPDFYFDLPLNTLEETALTRGVLDRSLLAIGAVRVMVAPTLPIGFAPESYDAKRVKGRFEGLISVIGVVQNRDSYPAQVTISAILRDADGVRLAETNVMDVMLHQLLPQEITPFRIDFSGADAVQILEIEQIAQVELVVRGVPTAYHIDRPLVLLTADTLYNASAQSVDIPHILATHTDADGGLWWVSSTYLQMAIAPDDTAPISPLSAVPADLYALDLPITITAPRLDEHIPTIPSFVVHGYSR